MPVSKTSRWFAAAVLTLPLAACELPAAPFSRLAGLITDQALHEASGIAASRVHEDVLWLNNDGDEAALYAITARGARIARMRVTDVGVRDWEDIAGYTLDGRHYLLLADTGDNGGLRKTLRLVAVEEPGQLREGAALKPAWIQDFRWPDGPRDCEALAVDPARDAILLISKKRQPPELFALPLRKRTAGIAVARRIGLLNGVPQADAELQRRDPKTARLHGQVTAADVSPDGSTLAVLTYSNVLLYARSGKQTWGEAVQRPPRVHEVPLIPQPEALGWNRNGTGLYATGEFSPAPLFYLTP